MAAADLHQTMTPALAVEHALRQRRFAEAATLAETALRQQPENAELLRLRGAALSASGRHAEALASIRQALVLRADDSRLHNSLGAALNASGDHDGATAAFRRGVEIDPGFAPAWLNLATALLTAKNDQGAMAALDRVLELQPKNLRARIMRSDILRDTQSGGELAIEYRRIIADHPDSGWPWYGLSNLKSVALSPADIDAMRILYAKLPADANDRPALGFALAKAFEDCGDFSASFGMLEQSNAAMRQRIPWDSAGFSRAIDDILNAFAGPVPMDSGLGGEVIFIVSLPRSGSTLVEQILASHSKVHGGDELPHAEVILAEENRRRGRPLVKWATEATAEEWQRLGNEYLDRTAKERANHPRFTDKAPDNWVYAGALMAMLPHARIINCRRDPVETGFSCYKQLFAARNQPFSYAIDDIGAYWRDYDRASRHWREIYPGRFYDLRYEDLQAEPERCIRELLEFCGLDFEPACVNFHETKRSVRTISAAQVREPLRRDTARAPKYGALLNPLREALGLSPPSAPDDLAIVS
jgi:tetratricopeptide (TPR) repeat protein